MRDNEIDEILQRGAETPAAVDPAVLDRISKSILPSLRPVHPLAPAWKLAAGLTLICAAVAAAGAAQLGMYGIRKLGVFGLALIFPALGVLTWLAATVSVGAVIPGSRRRIGPVTLLIGGCMFLVAVFALVFQNYAAGRFVHQGVSCLIAGLLDALPAGLLSWLLLRRGYAVNRVALGLAAGTLAGLAGVVMLELHCPILLAPHVMVWHTAVIPAGALLGWMTTFRARG